MLLNYIQRACALAAAACQPWIGKGDKIAADQAATEAMRAAFQAAPMNGRIVIGEGERDEAPMLHIGEKLGAGGPAIDIAVDPLEGTTLCAEARPGALTVAAFAPRGHLLHAPDVYMQKIAAGPELDLQAEDLDRPLADVIERLSKGRPHPLRVLMLDRPRHAPLKAQVRATDASLHFIGDGDVMGVLRTCLDFSPDLSKGPAFDLYVGSGGAPEGVLAASGLRHLGGRFFGRLRARNAAEHARVDRLIDDISRIYALDDLAGPEAQLVMSCVTPDILSTGETLTIGPQGISQHMER